MDEAASRAERVVESSAALQKSLDQDIKAHERTDKKIDELKEALNAHAQVMKEVADLLRGKA